MATVKSFPHVETHVNDNSARKPLIIEAEPLHLPLHLIFAERGTPNIPFYGSGDDVIAEFGKSTFDVRSELFKHQTLFASYTVGKQNAMYVRLVPDDAKKASVVLEAHVKTQGVTVPQYEKDTFGGRKLDKDGNPIPLLDSGGTPITEPGMEIVWKVRELEKDEKKDQLKNKDKNGVMIYPIFAFETEIGGFGNKIGFKLWFDRASDKGLVNSVGSLMFRFAPVEQMAKSNIAKPILDKFSRAFVEFSFKPNAIDDRTKTRMHIDDIMDNDYKALPFESHVYSDNIGLIGVDAKALEPNNIEISDEWMVNLLSGQDMKGNPYDHIVIRKDAADSVVMNEGMIHYFMGGADGDISDASFEALTRAWLEGTVYPEIKDRARYPITTIYDSGYTLDTKEILCDFLGIRDDVKVITSTQDVSMPMNSKRQDLHVGSELQRRALLRPESALYATEAIRATIMMQSGYLNDRTYTKLVPATYWLLQKKCEFMGTGIYKGIPAPRPHSEVDIFKEINWTPHDDDFKQDSWDTGLNYIEYCERNRLFIASMRSVYPLETSVLSSDNATDRIIILKHRARLMWSLYVGSEDPLPSYFDLIKEAIVKDVFDIFGNRLTVVPLIYQTDVEKDLGYKATVHLKIYDNVADRVWNCILDVNRNEGKEV